MSGLPCRYRLAYCSSGSEVLTAVRGTQHAQEGEADTGRRGWGGGQEATKRGVMWKKMRNRPRWEAMILQDIPPCATRSESEVDKVWLRRQPSRTPRKWLSRRMGENDADGARTLGVH